ncbi:MAG TPA: M3 family metallopeptidase [Anaerolineales bacterium]
MENGKYTQERWSLEDLFPGLDSPEFEQARQDLEEQVKRFESTRAELAEDLSAPRFLEILKAYEEIARVLGKIYSYGFLLFTEDTQNQKAQTGHAQVQQLVAEVNNRGLFFELWWKGLDEAASQRLMDASGDYRYWLEALRLHKPYTLTEPEEKLINLKDVNGVKALYNLYETITTRYTFKLEVDGEVKEMTRDELMVYVQGSDPALREAAYQEQFRVYGQDLSILGQIYQYMLRNWRSEHIDVRGFKSPIAVRNLSNDVPDEVVDTLLETCQQNAPLFHRYFRLKARWLGVDRLRRYDIYAPLAQSDRTYDYSEAVQMVLESFDEFHPRVAELARRVLDERHLDGEVRKGKWGGAFSMTVTPDLTPWVLSNYNRRPRDVSTLAHELGHAVHSMLAADHTALTFHATLPLAETASTFGEMLLTDRMLELDPDPAVQRDLLVLQLDDAYATILRQSFFAMFERTAHRLVHEGASVDDLSEAYFKGLQEQFGDALALSEDFKHEWSVIPHFFDRPFYVYAYSFGQLLVLSLYQQYRQEGETFKPRYLGILEAGSSEAPMRILDQAGIDVRSADFWRGGFRVVEESLKKLEALEFQQMPG